MKNYPAELTEWKKKQRQRNKETLVSFLAVRLDVKAAIDVGYALKTIWEHMHETGRVSFRYETFLRHVKRHITQAAVEQVKAATPGLTTEGKETNSARKTEILRPAQETKKIDPSTAGSFTFNPKPNKEELL